MGKPRHEHSIPLGLARAPTLTQAPLYTFDYSTLEKFTEKFDEALHASGFDGVPSYSSLFDGYDLLMEPC